MLARTTRLNAAIYPPRQHQRYKLYLSLPCYVNVGPPQAWHGMYRHDVMMHIFNCLQLSPCSRHPLCDLDAVSGVFGLRRSRQKWHASWSSVACRLALLWFSFIVFCWCWMIVQLSKAFVYRRDVKGFVMGKYKHKWCPLASSGGFMLVQTYSPVVYWWTNCLLHSSCYLF